MSPTKTRKRAPRRGFGKIRLLPSGRHQASYIGPDLARHNALDTFEAKGDAEGWLNDERRKIERDEWTPPAKRTAQPTDAPLIPGYIASWIETRLTPRGKLLAPKTKQHYKWLLKTYLEPSFDGVRVADMTLAMVRTWYAGLDTGATAKAHAYSLLQSAMQTAVDDDHLLDVNPCRIRGAGKAERDSEIRPATLDELEVIVKAMPERMQLLILLSAWCALRFGEVTELRRKDVDVKNNVVRIKRGVVRVDGEIIVGEPKSRAGKRPVHFPPELLPAVKAHLKDHTQLGPNGLLFWGPKTGKQLAHSSLLYWWNRAKHLADRDDMTPHALRHTGAVLAAQSGATIKELMARLGHSTAEMAIRYQHASEERDKLIAQRLGKVMAGRSATEPAADSSSP